MLFFSMARRGPTSLDGELTANAAKLGTARHVYSWDRPGPVDQDDIVVGAKGAQLLGAGSNTRRKVEESSDDHVQYMFTTWTTEAPAGKLRANELQKSHRLGQVTSKALEQVWDKTMLTILCGGR